MARGWESKDVEAQVESKEVSKASSGRDAKRDQQQRREQDIKQLQLSRIRITNDLKTATHPNHRKSLKAALPHLSTKTAHPPSPSLTSLYSPLRPTTRIPVLTFTF